MKRGWGGGSIAKALVSQAWIPGVHCQHPHRKPGAATIVPALGRQRWEDPWGWVASQSRLKGKLSVVRDLVLKNNT